MGIFVYILLVHHFLILLWIDHSLTSPSLKNIKFAFYLLFVAPGLIYLRSSIYLFILIDTEWNPSIPMSNPPQQVCWWQAGRSGQYLRVLWSPSEGPWQYLWFRVWSWPLHSQDLSIVPVPPYSPVPPLTSCFCPLQGSPILWTWSRDTAKGSRGWLAMSFVFETSSTSLGIAVSKSGNSCILKGSITQVVLEITYFWWCFVMYLAQPAVIVSYGIRHKTLSILLILER